MTTTIEMQLEYGTPQEFPAGVYAEISRALTSCEPGSYRLNDLRQYLPALSSEATHALVRVVRMFGPGMRTFMMEGVYVADRRPYMVSATIEPPTSTRSTTRMAVRVRVTGDLLGYDVMTPAYGSDPAYDPSYGRDFNAVFTTDMLRRNTDALMTSGVRLGVSAEQAARAFSDMGVSAQEIQDQMRRTIERIDRIATTPLPAKKEEPPPPLPTLKRRRIHLKK